MILRIKKHTRWTTIENSTLEDKRISFKARGILGYLLTKPNNWKVILSHLCTQAPEGIYSIRSGINELIEAGYIVREQGRSQDGKYEDIEYIVHEKSQDRNYETKR